MPPTVRLVGAQPSCAKLDAVKAVRGAAGWGLKPAKDAIDAALRGESPTIPLMEGQTASEVAEGLADLGFIAEADGRRYERPPDRPYVRWWTPEQVGAVQVLRVGEAQAGGGFSLDLRIVSGRLAARDQIGIPLSDSLLSTASVARTASGPGGTTAFLEGGPEAAEFWDAMNVVGEVLPVLPPAEGSAPDPPPVWRRWLASLRRRVPPRRTQPPATTSPTSNGAVATPTASVPSR